MADLPERVSGFYTRSLNRSVSPVRYLVLDPGGDHTYYFRPTRRDLRRVAGMIDGHGVKRRLGSAALRLLAPVPHAAVGLPYVTSRRLSVGHGAEPDVVVVSNRVRLIDRSRGVVHTLARDSPTGVVREINVRRSLPDGITTPELRDWDREVPYFTEAYVDGIQPGAPTENWGTFERAYEQLGPLYRRNPDEYVPTDRYVDNLLSTATAGSVPPDVLDRAERRLAETPLPSAVRHVDVHGDLHSRNLLIDSENLYLIDWENLRSDLAVADLFRPFLVTYYDTGDATPVVDMLRNESAYARSFADRVGEAAWGDREWYPGLVLLAALRSLVRISRDSPMWDRCLELTAELVDGGPG